ncbi:MAG: DinB family protein [Rhodospirillales bacterium]|nr:DinB family protein [Rhodospirillales bacterium]
MNDKKYLLNLLGYNVWANEQYFNQAHGLSSDEMTKKCQSLVKNILFSANHLLVINQAWLAYKKAKTRLFEMLQTVLNEELDDLFAAKRKMDKKIYTYISGFGDDKLEEVIDYELMGEIVGSLQRYMIIIHLAIHGGFYRGGIGVMFSQVSIMPVGQNISFYEHAMWAGQVQAWAKS